MSGSEAVAMGAMAASATVLCISNDTSNASYALLAKTRINMTWLSDRRG